MWSPSGSYLVVFMEWGFQLLGGPQLEELGRYSHENVKEVVFSGDEKYILSYNGSMNAQNGNENYIVWKLREVQKIRDFQAQEADTMGTF